MDNSKLKQIDGKHYKECKVVMLPTENRTNCLVKLHIQDMFHNYKHDYHYTQSYLKEANAAAYHLYIISDEEIKEGDWYIVLVNNLNEIHQRGGNDTAGIKFYSTNPWVRKCKKIIASTDESLGLPKPSDSFIQKYISSYNKGNKIEKVLVEYEKMYSFEAADNFDEVGFCGFRIKVSSDNTITIKKLKEEYSRDEVEKLLYSLAKESDKGFLNNYFMRQWIEENL